MKRTMPRVESRGVAGWFARLNALAEALDYDPLAFHERRIAQLEAAVASLENAMAARERADRGAS